MLSSCIIVNIYILLIVKTVQSHSMATEVGFVQGQSDHLPKIDVLSMFALLGNNPNFMGAELKGVKTASYVFNMNIILICRYRC